MRFICLSGICHLMANTGTKPLDWKGQTVLFSQSTNQLGTNMSESILKPR